MICRYQHVNPVEQKGTHPGQLVKAQANIRADLRYGQSYSRDVTDIEECSDCNFSYAREEGREILTYY